MQYSILFLAAATAASAQVTYNSTTGVFTCPADKPDGAFCAGDSLSTNIIIRCTAGVGHPGNCNDNLAGYFPFGVNYAPCWQTSTTSGDAACSKNCIVEGGSGNSNGTFTLPNCTPTPSPSATSTTTASSTGSSSSKPTTTASSSATSTSASTSTTLTLPPVTSTTSTAPTGGSTFTNNGTFTTKTTAGQTSATNTPAGPSGTTTGAPSTFTGGAVANSAGLSLAAIGLVAAYLL